MIDNKIYMKIILFLLFLPVLAAGQDSVVKYTKIIELDSSQSKNQLFEKARGWLNKTFVNMKNVMQITDRDAGELSGKGKLTVLAKYKNLAGNKSVCEIEFSFSIFVKDGRYKYVFGPIDNYDATYMPEIGIITSSTEVEKPGGLVSKKLFNDFRKNVIEAVDEKINYLINSLNETMQRKTEADF